LRMTEAEPEPGVGGLAGIDVSDGVLVAAQQDRLARGHLQLAAPARQPLTEQQREQPPRPARPRLQGTRRIRRRRSASLISCHGPLRVWVQGAYSGEGWRRADPS